MDAITSTPVPYNEPIQEYESGSPARSLLAAALNDLTSSAIDLPNMIGGKRTMASGERQKVVQPHARHSVLGVTAHSTAADAAVAVSASLSAAAEWRSLHFDDRAAIFLKAAELLAGPWRARLNAATMLGQSKTVIQAEIDAACELIDFWRFNVFFARQILADQPISSRGVWNRVDHRPLEGFVYAVTPFNFTSIAGNLPTAPALMGNTVVWKPARSQQLAASLLADLLEEAGLPAGVINMVTGAGPAISEVTLTDPNLAGIHFTGSTVVFHEFWRMIGAHIDRYRSYPRIVGETGGKDFVIAHPSADPAILRTALIRGAFEYQGQKCSAASRAYIPRSLWDAGLQDELADEVSDIKMGPVTEFENFMGAVIDERSFALLVGAINRARKTDTIKILAGGTYDDSEGWFIRPTVLVGTDPTDEIFTTEYFGPILAIHVYDDADYATMLTQVDSVSPYALTGSIIAQDRNAIAKATAHLRYSAGNFYINDKPTGAVVGQQPFGGARASGTNDKAGSPQNLLRWTSTRSIKETFTPPVDYRYPHMT